MAQPVWILSVDLQAKTATFQTGMADAARSARGAFSDIGGNAEGMGRRTGHGMMEARHSVMMLGEEFGIHIPRALATFVASLGPVGAALEAAFPFMAVIGLAALLIEHLRKVHEEGAKLTEDQIKFGTAVNNAFATLDKRLLEAQKRADELRGDHLGALHKELELINKASMEELVHSFEAVAKAADIVMKDLEGHWYTFGKGSEGAKHALDSFQTEYNSLLAQGKQEESSGLLRGTAKQAEAVLQALKDKSAYDTAGGDQITDELFQKGIAASKVLRDIHVETGMAFTNQIAAQANLVQSLQAQIHSAERIAELKKVEQSNATTATHQTIDKAAEDAARRHGEALLKYNSAVNAMMAADDQQSLEGRETREKESIAVTERGSQERLQAIIRATQEEQGYGRTNNAYYVDLLRQRVETARQMATEEARITQEAAREDAEHSTRMGEIALAAERQRMILEDSARRVTIARQIAEDTQIADEEYRIKKEALDKEIAGLDQYAKDYEVRRKALHDREKELTQAHEDELTSIEARAEIERNQRILSARERFNETIAQGLTQSIMGHETWAKMLQSLGDQMVSGMLRNAIMSMLTLDMTKEREAAAAARQGFLAGMKFPFPVNLVTAPVLAAAAFTSVMAFEGGTDRVPGSGRGDVVPSMLSPGEGVVPGGVMDGLRNMARSGGFERGPQINARLNYAPTIHALDAEGVDRVLDKHEDIFQRRFEQTLRRMHQ